MQIGEAAKRKDFRVRTVVYTCFEYGGDARKWLEGLKGSCDWVLGQEEKCESTGRLHVQGMAHHSNPIGWSYLKCHKEKCHKPADSIKYCSKEDTRVSGPFEFGERPTFNIKGAKASMAEKNKMLLEGDLKTLVDEGQISLLSLKRTMEARTIYRSLKVMVDEPKNVIKGFWHYGPPRTGKSTACRTGTYYLKGLNKWWDGYEGQDKVVLEDIDPSHGEWSLHFIKIWTDHHWFSAEVKGGRINVQIKEFHVTSNYYIHEVYGIGKPEVECRFNLIKYPLIGEEELRLHADSSFERMD